MKVQFADIDNLLDWFINSSNSINSVLEYIKWNNHLRIQLEEKTKFLNDKYLVQPLTQRLYHAVNNIQTIPANEHGWYKKFRNFHVGYDINTLQDVKNRNWEKLNDSEILSYILSSNSSVRTNLLQDWVKKHTKFLDQYCPSMATRTLYVRHKISYPIVNFDTNQLVGAAIYRKIKNYIEFDKYVSSLTDEEKKCLLKDWIQLSGGSKLSKTQQLKLCTPLVSFMRASVSDNLELVNTKNFSQLTYHVLNGSKIPLCDHCKTPLTERHFNSFLMSYSLTCSHFCNNKCALLIEKRLSNNSTNLCGYKTNVGIHEEYLCCLAAKQNNLNIEYNKQIGQYFVDGVDENKRVVIEVQEKHHAYSKHFKKDQTKINFLLNRGYTILLILDNWFDTKTKPSKNQVLYKTYFDSLANVFVKPVNLPKGKILTTSGWSSFLGATKTSSKNLVVTIITESNKKITLTSDHRIYFSETECKPAKDFNKGDVIMTDEGPSKVCNINTTSAEGFYAYDIIETTGNHFLANGIKVHNCVLLDEAAFIESHLLEEFWSSVIPTVSSGKKSKVLVVSTPNGIGNKFHEIYTGTQSGKFKTWTSDRIDWWDVPGRDEEWKELQIELLGSEERFQQEFGNTFLDDATSAVGAFLIEQFRKEKKDPIWVSEDGCYTVFEYPSINNLYVIGVDVSEGIGRAASVAQVLDVTNLQDIKQVAVYSSSRVEPYHFANILLGLSQSWGLPPMLIERNNCGAQVIDALFHNHSYEKIVSYSKISEKDRYNNTRNLGVLSHTNIRFDGIQNMRYWINHLQVVHVNDPETINEFETFVRFPNGTFRKKSDNFFDDRVMALTWALFVLETDLCQQYFEIAEFDAQNKPLKIKDNGFWEKQENYFLIKDLNNLERIIPKPYNYTNEVVVKSLNITNKDLDDMDKYDLDVEELFLQGYTFL